MHKISQARCGCETHGEKRRTQPESPRMLLSTLPFLALLVAGGLTLRPYYIGDNQPASS